MSTAPATEAGWQFDDAARARLLELLDTPAPSGYEAPAGDVFLRQGGDFADVRRDAIGNCFATVNAPADGTSRPRVMVTGHLDEIGFVVTKLTDAGFVKFSSVGGWDAPVVVGQRVLVRTDGGDLPGTVGRLAAHQLDRDDTDVKLKDLWIDVGAPDGDWVREHVRPGDPIVLDATPVLLQTGRVMSRSLDNRIGTFVALEVARRCVGLDVEVVAVGTVREETVQTGAWTASHALQPDAACVIDVCPATDVPGEHDEDVRLDRGPAITIGATTSARVTRALVDVANAGGRPFQLQAAGRSTSTDADEVVQAGAGVEVVVVSVPCRYLHTPGELLTIDDVAGTIDLLVDWVRTFR